MMTSQQQMTWRWALIVALTALALLATVLATAQTASNTCGYDPGNEYPVGTVCQTNSFDKPTSFSRSGAQSGCSGSDHDDAWGWFTATGSMTQITYDPDNSHRPIVHVFTGACSSLTQVACANGGSNGANAQLSFATTPGTAYMIRVQRHGTDNAMNGELCIWSWSSADVCAQLPENELDVTPDCTFQEFSVHGSFSPSMNPGGCNAGNRTDAWGWFTATASRTAITFDPDLSHRPILHVFSGSCGGLTLVACNDGSGNGRDAEVSIATTIGAVYHVRVQRYASDLEMLGRICVRPALPNDACETPTVLPVLQNCFMQTFSNDRATRSTETPNPSCGGTINNNTLKDIWFSFTAPGSGQVIIETQAGTLTDAVMQLYSGSCGSLVAVACDDDGGPGLMPTIDRTCDPLTPGETYLVRLWGFGGQRGDFGICVYGPDQFAPMQEDCTGAALVCSDQQINNNAQDFGCTQDLSSSNRGCLLGNERQGTWYYFNPFTSGTVEFTITPTADVDYDYALWGPVAGLTCPPPGNPVRCSYAWPPAVPGYPASSAYLTGLRASNTDNSEPASGGAVNGFTAPLDVVAGSYYILYVDNFDITGQAFNLDWTLTNGCSLDCTVLPVEIVHFGADAYPDHILVSWTTQTEDNSSHFIVERSTDGVTFDPVGRVNAAGQSLGRIDYQWKDSDPHTGLNFYRLKQVDLDGSFFRTEVVSAEMKGPVERLRAYPNPAVDQLTVELQGLEVGPAHLMLQDASGRILRVQEVDLQGQQRTVRMSVGDLDAGSYVLALRQRNGILLGTGRFMKQ